MHDMMSQDERLRWSGGDRELRKLAGQVVDVLARRGVGGQGQPNPTLLARMRAAALGPDRGALDAVIVAMRAARITPEQICDRYIPACARQLGAEWGSDELGFADVTIGCARLQSILRELGHRSSATDGAVEARHAVLVAVPEAEDHVLGALLIAGQLRRAGVSVCLRLQVGMTDVAATAATRDFDAVLLSVANVERLGQAAAFVAAVRRALPRPVPIFLGGAVVGRHDDLQAATGADVVAADLPTVLGRLALDAPLKRAQRRA